MSEIRLPRLPVGPLPNPAMDYTFLRREGIAHLERLSGHAWTDLNAHDPGITILEQLCYALTDFGYRIAHEIPDLLAEGGRDPQSSLPGPESIATSRPVTLVDLRKLVLDVPGVANAWIETIDEPDVPVHYHKGTAEIRIASGGRGALPVSFPGLYRVLVEKVPLADGAALVARVARRLHDNRGLCEDFQIQVLDVQNIRLFADIEIAPVDDAERVLVDIWRHAQGYLSPMIPFASLDEMLAAGSSVDQIFDGPRLLHGFVDPDRLARSRRHTSLFTSDLIQEIMNVPGVRTVRSIAISTTTVDGAQPWVLPLPSMSVPTLDIRGSEIVLSRDGLKVSLDVIRAQKEYDERQWRDSEQRFDSARGRALAPPPGKGRDVARYTSIQRHLPALYGIGELGLPESAPPLRRAQAKQLKAYLSFFDQLLCNLHAQLAHMGDLFAVDSDGPRTYFARMIDDPSIGLEAVRTTGKGDLAAWLDEQVEGTIQGAGAAGAGAGSARLWQRKNRFSNHLLARFSEQLTDYSLVLFDALEGMSGASPEERLARDKQAFLRDYALFSGARGTGASYLEPVLARRPTGLALRIHRELGLRPEDDEKLYIVEHLLLRPQSEDMSQYDEESLEQVPILGNVGARDPYSLQLSFVLPSWPLRWHRADQPEGELASHGFRAFIEQTLRRQTPAHLTPYVYWLGRDEWAVFEELYGDWASLHQRYSCEKLGPPAGMTNDLHLSVRAARDRLIDFLGFGTTYPLRDLAVRADPPLVGYKLSSQIVIEPTQKDVLYRLRDHRTGEVISRVVGGLPVPVEARGTGGPLVLVTPGIVEDTTYDIEAVKVDANGAERDARTLLHRRAVVGVGLATAFAVRILAPPLDPKIAAPADTDARIAAHGSVVQVEILQSQEGVTHRVVDAAKPSRVLSKADVIGNAGTIVLDLVPLTDDVDIRVFCSRVFETPGGDETRTALSDAVLPLKIGADPRFGVSLGSPPVVPYDGGTTLKVAGTQVGVRYTVHARALGGGDFLGAATPPGPGQLFFPMADGSTVRVARPPYTPVVQLAGFAVRGAPQVGAGGPLVFPVTSIADDLVMVVRAEKEHRRGLLTATDAKSLEKLWSDAQLQGASVVLTTPNPRPRLVLFAWFVPGAQPTESRTVGAMSMQAGQAGLEYEIRLASVQGIGQMQTGSTFMVAGAAAATAPAGIGGMRVGRTFKIGAQVAALAAPPEPVTLPPATDTLAMDTVLYDAPRTLLSVDATVRLRAIKPWSGLAVDLESRPEITCLPPVAVSVKTDIDGEVTFECTVLVPDPDKEYTFMEIHGHPALGRFSLGEASRHRVGGALVLVYKLPRWDKNYLLLAAWDKSLPPLCVFHLLPICGGGFPRPGGP